MKKQSSGYSPQTLQAVRGLHRQSGWQLGWMLAKTWGQIALFPLLYSVYSHPLIIVLGVLLIGARQASIFEINHEAAHYKLFKTARANKYFSLVFCIIPFLNHVEAFSFVQWRRVHRLHHSYLMTEKDPNYLQRKMTGEADKPFTVTDTAKAMLKAVVTGWYGFLTFRQDYVWPDGKTFEKHRYPHWRYLLPIKGDREMQQELLIRWVGYITLLATITWLNAWLLFFLFWLLPMYTSYPAILKLMDIMDHNWSDNSGDLARNSNSRSMPWPVRWLTSDLYRYYHREHHQFPMVPALNMPKLHKLLREQI